MPHRRTGTLRVTGTRFELTALSDEGHVIGVDLDIPPHTAHVIRHVAASNVDLATGQRRRCRRTLLERALGAVGAIPERLEVVHGDPPRFVLVVVSPAGCLRRLDLDLADTAELLLSRSLPVVATGWPERDWDDALRTFAE